MGSEMHTMRTVTVYPDGWLVECPEPGCGRREVLSRAALQDGEPADIEMVLFHGDETVAHSWSTTEDLRIGVKIGARDEH